MKKIFLSSITFFVIASAANFIYPAAASAVPAGSDEKIFSHVFQSNKNNIIQVSAIYKNQNVVGSGFITKEGFIITANHVVGTSSTIKMVYQNVTYVLRACYRDHANDVAVLYPIEFINSFNSYEYVPYDSLKTNNFTYEETAPKKDDSIMVIGYPFGIVETKRIIGKYKETKNRYLSDVQLYACDLSVINGCSGGPVFNKSGRIIGIATSAETAPTATEYLVSYVSPIKNIEKITEFITPEYMDKIKEISKGFPGLNLSVSNLRTNFYSSIEYQNIGFNKELNTFVNKSDSGSIMLKEKDSVIDLFFNILCGNLNKDSESKNLVDIYIKKTDENNYIALRMDYSSNNYYLLYVSNGAATVKPPVISMPIITDTFYNIEIRTKGKNMGIWFDNIPVYSDNDLPVSEGQTGITFQGINKVVIDNLFFSLPIVY
ncbi:MAG: serine protease [Brevinematales bacterium]|jgi:hypothetical protein